MKSLYPLFVLIAYGIIVSTRLFYVLAQDLSIFDLVNLKNQKLADITAYEKIKIIDAWNLVELIKPSTTAVSVGIFDTGIDIFHPEFNNVRIATAINRDSQEDGHGTQVAGIIGANNLSFGGQYIPPQMNGILSGVRGLNYTLHIRSMSEFAEFTTSTDNFLHFAVLDQLSRSSGGLDITNSSFGLTLCVPELSIILRSQQGCYTRAQFDNTKSVYEDLVSQYASTTFVFSAGNEGIDSQFHLPGGGINASNTLTIGATDLDDKRATRIPPLLLTLGLLNSNSGLSTNISAPGVKIYAPKPLGIIRSYIQNFGGTSGAAPMVTGVAAILKFLQQEYQKFTPGLVMFPAKIKEILVKSADPIITDKPLGKDCFNFNPAIHNGCRLNAHRAVAWQFPPKPVEFSISTTTAGSLSLAATTYSTPKFNTSSLFDSQGNLKNPFQPRGTIEGIGTHFEIKDSQYLNITVDSSKIIKLRAQSIPEVITLFFYPNFSFSSSSSSTQITLKGLIPNKVYFQYQDDPRNPVIFTADQTGVHTFTQDLGQPHLIFFQTKSGTKTISDTPTGGDCSLIGIWNQLAKVCTLTQDVFEPIIIVSDNLTLDGNNHLISGSPAFFAGVSIFQQSGITVKNLNIQNFQTGLILDNSNNISVFNNKISNNSSAGLRLFFSSSNQIISNNISNNRGSFTGDGLILDTSNSNNIANNTISENRIHGVFNPLSADNIFTNNKIQENDFLDVRVIASTSVDNCRLIFTNNLGTGNLPIKFFNTQTIIQNEHLSELLLCNASGSVVRNSTIQGSPVKFNNGVFLELSGGVLLENNLIFNVNSGILLDNSGNVKILNNTLRNNVTGIFLARSAGTEIKNNQILENILGILMTLQPNHSIISDNTIQNNFQGFNFIGSGGNNKTFNNNLINNQFPEGTQPQFQSQSQLLPCPGPALDLNFCPNDQYSQPLPQGGNHWSNLDEPDEGCNDVNNDNICDHPRIFTVFISQNGSIVEKIVAQDQFPWKIPDGWKRKTINVNLSWTKSDPFQNPDFNSYKIFRSPTTPVTLSSALIKIETNSSTLAFTDQNLLPDQTFFYKVFLFDKAGLSAGSNEVRMR